MGEQRGNLRRVSVVVAGGEETDAKREMGDWRPEDGELDLDRNRNHLPELPVQSSQQHTTRDRLHPVNHTFDSLPPPPPLNRRSCFTFRLPLINPPPKHFSHGAEPLLGPSDSLLGRHRQSPSSPSSSPPSSHSRLPLHRTPSPTPPSPKGSTPTPASNKTRTTSTASRQTKSTSRRSTSPLVTTPLAFRTSNGGSRNSRTGRPHSQTRQSTFASSAFLSFPLLFPPLSSACLPSADFRTFSVQWQEQLASRYLPTFLTLVLLPPLLIISPSAGPFPLLFHDISQEIPEGHQSTVLTLYRIWMFLVLTLAINLVGAILLLISGASNGGSDLGAAIMYVPVIGALSFLLWYRPCYNAYAKEYSFFYCATLPPSASSPPSLTLFISHRHLLPLRRLPRPLLRLHVRPSLSPSSSLSVLTPPLQQVHRHSLVRIRWVDQHHHALDGRALGRGGVLHAGDGGMGG